MFYTLLFCAKTHGKLSETKKASGCEAFFEVLKNS